MSLRIWLPLTGNLNNNGVSETIATNYNITFDTNGKLGSCALISTAGNKLTIPNPINTSTDEFSISCWFYLTQFTNGYACICCDRTQTSGKGIAIWIQASAMRIDTNEMWTFSKTTDLNTWYHFCLTWSKTKGKYVYIDGVQVAYKESVGLIDNITSTLWIAESMQNNVGSYSLVGKLNDFRIYDHALSVKEIKEIAKGLICHYPLDGMGANKNLFDFQSIASKWVQDGANAVDYEDDIYGNVLKVIATSNSKRIYRSVSNVWNQDQIYTVSFLAKADEEVSCNMSRSIANYSPNFTLSTEWKRYYGQITSTVTTSGGTLSFTILSTDIPVYITQVKLELGDKVTPYVPGEGDSSYNVLNLNNLSLPDISGITQENATIVRSVNNIINSPRYLLSTQFTHDYKSVITLPNFNFEYMDYGTLSFWINIHSFKYWSHFVFFANSFNWTGKEYDFIIVATSGNSGDTEYESKAVCLDCCSYTNSYTMSVNTWYHIVITWDAVNYVIKRYVNGILHSTNDDSTNKRLDTYRTKHNNHFLGNGYITDNNRGYFDLSDFRLYSTCLSADDIKELYNKPIILTNNGDMISQGEYVEDNSALQFYKNGIIKSAKIVEDSLVDVFIQTNPVQQYTPTDINNWTTTYGKWMITDDDLPGDKFRIYLTVQYNGFDTSSTSGTFNIRFQGANFTSPTTSAWSGSNAVTNALNSQYSLKTLVLSGVSGTYTYECTFTLTEDFYNNYYGSNIGLRSDYSNGTAWIKVSDIKIIPEKYLLESNVKTKVGQNYISTKEIIEN